MERNTSMKLYLETKKIVPFLQFIFIFCWVSQLIYTDSYFSVYALCAMVSAICLFDNTRQEYGKNRLMTAMNLLLASLLSLTVSLSNYPIFQRFRDMDEMSLGTNTFLNVLEAVITFIGGIVVFYQILMYVSRRFPVSCDCEKKLSSGKNPKRVFAGVLFFLSAIYLVYLFFVVYPGNVTSDSVWQIGQILSGGYTNHHPFWHTMSIKVCMAIGYALFGTSNAAAATFSVVQSIAMAACFAYAVVTLYQYRVPKMWVWIFTFLFAVLPVHISYSCTMWKDVPFGGAVLILVVSMFRIIRGIGSSKRLNHLMLLVGGIGSSILRTNGWYAMIAAFVILILFFRKRCRELILPWIICLVVGWLLTSPVLFFLGVYNENFIEGLSVPLQQVARVITNGGELTQEEYQFMDSILDVEQVPELYTEHCVDPIKDAVRLKDYHHFLRNKGEFIRHWLQIGLRYPWEYVEAWVEETKGYWNGGYDYYIYAQYVSDNGIGMYMVEQNNIIHTLVKAYFRLTRETVLFEPLQSIGLHVWILSMLCFFNLIHNRREFLLTVPVLAVVFTLWLTTPVFCEFRYAYSVFTTVPFILVVSLFERKEEEILKTE